MHTMKVVVSAGSVLLALGLAGQAFADASKQNRILKRGAYVAATGGCDDCHTPLKMGANGPEPDFSRRLSGHPESLPMPPAPNLGTGPWVWVGSGTNTAFAGPWGVTYAFNLTPDTETGVGKWREQDFIAALRTGKHLGTGRAIQPPMPWRAYGNLPDADLKALFAYLKSLPPIRNRVPDYQPPTSSAAK